MRLARWLGAFGHLILRRVRGFAAHISKGRPENPENFKLCLLVQKMAQRDWHLSNREFHASATRGPAISGVHLGLGLGLPLSSPGMPQLKIWSLSIWTC